MTPNYMLQYKVMYLMIRRTTIEAVNTDSLSGEIRASARRLFTS